MSGCLSAIAWCKLSLKHPSHKSGAQFDPSSPYRSPGDPAAGGGGGVYACEDSYIYIPIAFIVVIYIVYLVECWHCRVRHQLLGSVDARTVYDQVRALREALPIVWWKAVCYHYVRRSRQVARYRNGGAFTSTQVYYERVNSHVGTRAFDYAGCGVKDVSRRLADLDKFPSAKIRLTKRFSFATPEAEREFEEQREEFFSGYERMDDYMETREGVDFVNVNFREEMVVFADPQRLPWYVSSVVFWVASVLLLSWPIRLLIQYKTAYVHYFVHKVFGCNYLGARRSSGGSHHNQQRSVLTREDTMDSNELEMTIRSNYVLVPSYSEALLMEFPLEASASAARSQIHPRIDHFQTGIVNTSRLVALSSGSSRSYGSVGVSRNQLALLRVTGGSVSIAEHPHRRGWLEGGDAAMDGRPERRGGMSWARRWRRSYYEAVCFGASSSLTVDADDERVLQVGGSGRRSLVGSIGYGRTMIAASASSPESIAPLPAASRATSSSLFSSVPHFAFGRPGSWSGVPDPRHQECGLFLSSRQRKGRLAASPSVGTGERDPEPISSPLRSGVGNPAVSPVPSDHTIPSAELPPSYEVALRMEQVHPDPIDLVRSINLPHDRSSLPLISSKDLLEDDVSISTMSTYISDSVQGTPRHHQQQQQRMVASSQSRRNSADDAFINPSSVETTL